MRAGGFVRLKLYGRETKSRPNPHIPVLSGAPFFFSSHADIRNPAAWIVQQLCSCAFLLVMASSNILLRKDARFDVLQLQIAERAMPADTRPELLPGVLRTLVLNALSPKD
jgi:hypothetical protein